SSAERQRFLGISKAGSRVLRYLLVEAAHTTIRHDEDLQRFYKRLVARRRSPKAKTAVARKLLIRAFIMLRDEIDYAEFQRRAVAARHARHFSSTPRRGVDGAAGLDWRRHFRHDGRSNRGSEDVGIRAPRSRGVP